MSLSKLDPYQSSEALRSHQLVISWMLLPPPTDMYGLSGGIHSIWGYQVSQKLYLPKALFITKASLLAGVGFPLGMSWGQSRGRGSDLSLRRFRLMWIIHMKGPPPPGRPKPPGPDCCKRRLSYIGHRLAYLGPMLGACWGILKLCWAYVGCSWAEVSQTRAM